jgi:hypothetical protein
LDALNIAFVGKTDEFAKFINIIALATVGSITLSSFKTVLGLVFEDNLNMLTELIAYGS